MRGWLSVVFAATLTSLATDADAGRGANSVRVRTLQVSFEERLQSGRSLLEQDRSAAAVGLLEEAVRLRNAHARPDRPRGQAYFETGRVNRPRAADAASRVVAWNEPHGTCSKRARNAAASAGSAMRCDHHSSRSS